MREKVTSLKRCYEGDYPGGDVRCPDIATMEELEAYTRATPDHEVRCTVPGMWSESRQSFLMESSK